MFRRLGKRGTDAAGDTRGGTRELNLLSHARHSLSGVLYEQGQNLQSFMVGENATSAPQSRLGNRRKLRSDPRSDPGFHSLQTLIITSQRIPNSARELDMGSTTAKKISNATTIQRICRAGRRRPLACPQLSAVPQRAGLDNRRQRRRI
jgi:hypothetical protein